MTSLTLSEQATLFFYQWDYQYRGYYHFDTPIDIEVPYFPFSHDNYIQKPIEDDGRLPSLLESIGSLFLPKATEEVEEENKELQPTYIAPEDAPIYVGFSVSFQKGQNILPIANIEFLNMLTFTAYPISFEIVGTKEEIRVQFVCNELDKSRVSSHIKAYFPTAILRDVDVESFGFNKEKDVAIADFGMNNEFVRPIFSADSFAIDPLTSLIATMDSLQNDDVVVFQTIFKGITSPLAKDIPYAVSDGAGGSFFGDAPEMPKCAEDKTSNPLFSVIMRIGTQGNTDIRSQYLAQELARSITAVSASPYNKLIPLSNEGYDYGFHLLNLHHRLSNRLGFILNSKELNTFIHYPNNTVISSKLGVQGKKTKRLPKQAINQKYILGVNEHHGEEIKVTLSDEARLRHTHIIGATGVGKSTLIANMMLEDMKNGNGCALFDPHGDIVEDVLLRIPEHRKNDVILIDPYDTEFPIGFNILSAHTDAEKIVLSSDMVGAFKRFATSWGDTMSSVLSQAVNTFLESSKGGTLIELKRFLLEDNFRRTFLETVEDPSIHYYWNHEYGFLKKRISPLLTRIDTFLRPKIVRYMLAQKSGIDFRECIEKKKIVLIKLSQGLIGEDNSYLLGSLFLSKFNQVAQSRQNLSKDKRHPYFIYCDEFQNFVTPSISQILSGARKYGLGLILAHQEIAQIDDYKVLNSVISNPYIRICFRLGDIDARKLADGFSYFEQSDLQSLGIGQAIMRIGSATNDCNIITFPLPSVNTELANSIKNTIVEHTRNNYAQPKAEIDKLLQELLPRTRIKKDKKEEIQEDVQEKSEHISSKQRSEIKEEIRAPIPQENSEFNTISKTKLEKEKEKYLASVKENETIQRHRVLQNNIRTLAIQRGFKATIEQETEDGGRVDVALVKDDIRIAIEISVTNTVDYEVKNIQKCMNAGYTHICMLSESEIHLKNIKKRASTITQIAKNKKIQYLIPDKFPKYLDGFLTDKKTTVKRIRGYTVKSNHIEIQGTNMGDKNNTLKEILLKSLKKGGKSKKKKK